LVVVVVAAVAVGHQVTDSVRAPNDSTVVGRHPIPMPVLAETQFVPPIVVVVVVVQVAVRTVMQIVCMYLLGRLIDGSWLTLFALV
jgi:hypothetical protein